MKRLSFSDLEAICERQNCRVSDLFLIGNEVFVMLDADDRRIPSNHRPLLFDDRELSEALPEALRRLDATQFESREAFERARAYDATHTAEFEKLKYELYDLLAAASRDRQPPDGGQFYLELGGAAGENVLLVCESAGSLGEPVIAGIEAEEDMPIDGLPDPHKHRVCMRCTQWFEPNEGSAAAWQSFGISGGIADGIRNAAAGWL